MKKSILALAVILGASTTFAQDLTSKKGENYLPQAGDWAIGIDAVPVLNYIGNFFGKTANNVAPTWEFTNPKFAITGKYFIEDGKAYRVGVNLGWTTAGSKDMVSDRTSTAANPWPSEAAMVENTMKARTTNIALTAGMEWRKGTTRLQGFYGAEVGIGINSSSQKYTYGNALVATTAANAAVINDMTDDNYGGNIYGTTDGNGNPIQARINDTKSGLGFSLGIRGFIGAEYFILPKLALGGEFGWGIGLGINGKSTTNSEAVGQTNGAADGSVQTITREGGKSSAFGLGTNNSNGVWGPSGRLNLTFYF